MKLPIYQIDAFTGSLFGGNPAAVVLLHDWLSDELLQAIAAENNLSETAYVVPRGQHFGLRWFTPTIEIDLCGHATLASAFVLFREKIAEGDEIRFETVTSGELSVRRDGALIQLDFPARVPQPIAGSQALTAALGAEPSAVFQARDLLAVFDHQDQVAALQPDFERIASLETFAVIVSAPGDEVDFVSRFFAPKAGVPEDPVTGSAHCSLIPYWSRRLGKTSLQARQISRRGGQLFCENRGARVIIGGHAVQYLRGEISVE